MSLSLPIHTARDEENNCLIYKFGAIDKRHELDGRYCVAGAVCWPGTVDGYESDSVSSGYIVAAAQNIATLVVHVFMESEFAVIDPILRPDGGIEYAGLAQWLNEASAKLVCSKFFWQGDQETHRTFMLSTNRSINVEPKPHYVELPRIPEEQAMHSLNTLIETGRIKINKEGPIFKALEVGAVRPGPKPPCLVCACTLAAGFQRFPYRRPW